MIFPIAQSGFLVLLGDRTFGKLPKQSFKSEFADISKDGVINLAQNSRLRIWIPVNQVRLVYPLAGKSLRIGKHKIRLGIPDIYLLQPAKQLRSRILVSKKVQHHDHINRQMNF
ncbi:type I-MYXAN CRISPR-associated protein Cas6/Cmx6 [Atlanticothrix silvestris]|uniref:type I-MYXAN CRISPR-associated protein Cas6/Cmx6 n=1 Tax=Atlanticothrix silvestris TaxID=2840444 RepID=UPI001CECBE88|nr:type I-MYXAN CRISPR-associated protein Cas6/Cmx6 [Atlanticothrix silvestris]